MIARGIMTRNTYTRLLPIHNFGLLEINKNCDELEVTLLVLYQQSLVNIDIKSKKLLCH